MRSLTNFYIPRKKLNKLQQVQKHIEHTRKCPFKLSSCYGFFSQSHFLENLIPLQYKKQFNKKQNDGKETKVCNSSNQKNKLFFSVGTRNNIIKTTVVKKTKRCKLQQITSAEQVAIFKATGLCRQCPPTVPHD